MGKGRPRAVEKGVLGHAGAASCSTSGGGGGGTPLPEAPVFHPTEDEFRDPLAFISKIRPLAEPFGLCRIVPPSSWRPPFPPDLESLVFPTKSQPIHRLQARPTSFDSVTFNLEYSRFLESHLNKRPSSKRRVVFEGADLDLCRLFHATKRYGGYRAVCREKRWGDVSRLVLRPGREISRCAEHVLRQLYLEHLIEYEEYQSSLAKNYRQGRLCGEKKKHCKRGRGLDEKKLKEEALGGRFDQICEQCKSGLHGDVMLLCDRCDKGWHLYCLSPPLQSVPSGNWYCSECVNSDKDSFGFVSGKLCSLENFRRMDERFRKKWFGQGRVSKTQIEKRFWDIVEGIAGEVEVMYGNDLDTSLYGSGFPRADDPVPESVDPKVWKEYASSPWNLNNFPKLEGSMLCAVRDNIAGVMVPWLYVGMLFSSFCWHVEDHCFYSINYLHWGEPKCWYGVPGSAANAFEQVMRNTLPDLFEAQPDLLFQLVTMLNPSVLLEKAVPVYSVLQEPGNFVITFPRSFHGGFNFGLNCAEAVNFAPADWLPHGGYWAELYQTYHRAAVLSHEELLYVVAKNGCASKALPFLKAEMQRILAREKRFRQDIWRNGIVRSSLMAQKKHPEYVGHEEDPICIICQQFLYLSAIACDCRPSAFVCLEHWKHLCECDPSRCCLLYRYTLAELGDLVDLNLAVNVESPLRRDSWKHPIVTNESASLAKKVKGGHLTYEQLAEDWLSNACHIFEIPFVNSSYNSALKEAEQFLWADHEMDPVRDMANKLVEAQKWALDVKQCLLKMDNYLHCGDTHTEKVLLQEVQELLSFDPSPCCEPGFTKLKAFIEDAKLLSNEIEFALSSCLPISELELLYSKAIELPINLEQTEILAREISSSKVCMSNVSKFLSGDEPGTMDIESLYMLKSEMLALRVHLPEMGLLHDWCKEVESWQLRSKELLRGPLKLKELEEFLLDSNHLPVSIPELELLKQYYGDARSWICNLHGTLQNRTGRNDFKNIVEELSCVLKAGNLLKVQVDELPLIEAELNRSSCREQASKALSVPMSLELIQHLLAEASLLEIEKEELFIEIFEVLTAAISWEGKAKYVLDHAAAMSDFEDLVRVAENISVVLPSLPLIKDAVSVAHSWILRCQPFLVSMEHNGDGHGPLLKIDDLKELVAQSKFLKVTLDIPDRLEGTIKELTGWKQNACSLLEHVRSFSSLDGIDNGNDLFILDKVDKLLRRIESASSVGVSLGFELNELQTLQHASSTLQWSFRSLSFCSSTPSLKEVESLLQETDNLPSSFSDSTLVKSLVEGTSWLRRACLVIPEPQSTKRYRIKDAEEILEEVQSLCKMQKIFVPYPVMVDRLQNTIKKHKSWMEEVHVFFQLPGEQPWPLLLNLKETGDYVAFDCPELDKVVLKVDKVKQWMHRCCAIVEPLVGDLGSLALELAKVKSSMERSLGIYHRSGGCRMNEFCVCCPSDSGNDLFSCLTCKDKYHFSCMGLPLATADAKKKYVCRFCLFMEGGALSRSAGGPLIFRGKRPELNSFIELASIAENFHMGRIEEVPLVRDIVKLSLECMSCLAEILNHALSHQGRDLCYVSESLTCALKAVSVAGVYDRRDASSLETALSMNSWKIRVNTLLRGSKRPAIHQLQRLLKEGLALPVQSEDYYMKEIAEAQRMSMQWAEAAKKVAVDLGLLELSDVFKLINEGETLPVQFDKEMKLLKGRAVLYCICRKPYDQRGMIACDQCDEWYHFDCINLIGPPPKSFVCPACKPFNRDFVSLPQTKLHHDQRSSIDGAPRTPPARLNEAKARCSRKSNKQKTRDFVDLSSTIRNHSEIDYLWRENRRPLQRTARKRIRLEGFLNSHPFPRVNE